jgi:Rieske Fe-S protein
VVIALVAGVMWAWEASRGVRGEAPEVAPERRVAGGAQAAGAASDVPLKKYSRSHFLEASTIGLGVAIGAAINVPILGFMVLPAFTNQDEPEVDLGPLENFPQDTFVIATYFEDPSQGEVSRRTAFIRNNGLIAEGEYKGQPSFTILFSRCVHLGCPVQPNGPVEEKVVYTPLNKDLPAVELYPVLAQSFGCPCHGGLYDSEGRRTAGPPVRSMDRYEYSIKNGRLVIGSLFSVGNVSNGGSEAVISRYDWVTPGVHVDGFEAWLYPIVPSQVTS